MRAKHFCLFSFQGKKGLQYLKAQARSAQMLKMSQFIGLEAPSGAG